MYLPSEVTAALPPPLRPEDVQAHTRLDGVTGQADWKTLHLLVTAQGLVWLGQRALLDKAQALTLSAPPALAVSGWDHALTITLAGGEAHSFRVPSYEVDKLQKLLTAGGAPWPSAAGSAAALSGASPSVTSTSGASPSVTAASGAYSRAISTSGASPSVTAASGAYSRATAASGAFISAASAASTRLPPTLADVAASALAGRFDDARRALFAIADARPDDPYLRRGADEYALLFDDLIGDRPEDMLLRATEVSAYLTAIDPHGWIERACTQRACDAFARRGDLWWRAFGLLNLCMSTDCVPCPGLMPRPWLALRAHLAALNAVPQATRQRSLRTVFGRGEAPSIGDALDLDDLSRVWSKRRKQWLKAYAAERPGDLKALHALAVDLAYSPDSAPDKQRRFIQHLDEVLSRDPGNLEATDLFLSQARKMKALPVQERSPARLQRLRADLLKHHLPRAAALTDSGLQQLICAALYLEDDAAAHTCAALLRARGHRWRVGALDADDALRLLTHIERGDLTDISEAADALLCDATIDRGSGQVTYFGEEALVWAVAQRLERGGDLITACALLAMIQGSDPEASARATRLTATLNEQAPFTAYERCTQRALTRLRARLRRDPCDLHAARCLTLASLHEDTFGAGLLRATAALRAHPADIDLMYLLSVALTQSLDEDDPDTTDPHPSDAHTDPDTRALAPRDLPAARADAVAALTLALDDALRAQPDHRTLLDVASLHHADPHQRLRCALRLADLDPDDAVDPLRSAALTLLDLRRLTDLRAHLDTLCASTTYDDDYIDKLLRAQALLDRSSPSDSDLACVRLLIQDQDPDGDDDDADDADDADDDDDDADEAPHLAAKPAQPAQPTQAPQRQGRERGASATATQRPSQSVGRSLIFVAVAIGVALLLIGLWVGVAP
jgi:hypothetical protein